VLTIYIDIMTDNQLAEWRHATLLWQIRATVAKKPGKAPAAPPLVRKRYKL